MKAACKNALWSELPLLLPDRKSTIETRKISKEEKYGDAEQFAYKQAHKLPVAFRICSIVVGTANQTPAVIFTL